MDSTVLAGVIGGIFVVAGAVISGILLKPKPEKSSQSARTKGGGNAVNAGGNVHIGDVITSDNTVVSGDTVGARGNVIGANVYQSSNRQYSLTPSPKDIEEAISDLPPLQRKSIFKHYIGLKVRWKLKLSNVSQGYIPALDYLPQDAEERSKYVAVYGKYSNEPMQVPSVVACYVLLEEYPQLNLMKSNHSYWVSGEITDVDGLVSLKDASLEIVPNANTL